MGLSWFFFGFSSAFACAIGAIMFYFTKLHPRLANKFRGQRVALSEQAQAVGPAGLDASSEESLEWISSLLGRFWKTIRESDSFLGPLHLKVEKKLRDGLAKVPSKVRACISDIQFSLKPGAFLPQFTHAHCSGDSNVDVRIFFGDQDSRLGSTADDGGDDDPDSPSRYIFLAEIETSVLLPFEKIKIPNILLPIRIAVAINSISGCLALSHPPYPSHEMRISLIGQPTFDWELNVEIGSFRLHRFLLDTLRLRSIVDDFIAIKLMQKIVAPNGITTRIPLSPPPETAPPSPS